MSRFFWASVCLGFVIGILLGYLWLDVAMRSYADGCKESYGKLYEKCEGWLDTCGLYTHKMELRDYNLTIAMGLDKFDMEEEK